MHRELCAGQSGLWALAFWQKKLLHGKKLIWQQLSGSQIKPSLVDNVAAAKWHKHKTSVVCIL
jgi:hypothetical protein